MIYLRLLSPIVLSRRLTLLVSLLGLILCASLPSSALPFGSGSFGSCQFSSCSITLSSYGLVNLDIAPQPTPGICTIQHNAVSVLTDDSNGFSLTLNDAAPTTALQNGSASIAATSGTLVSPTPLTVNTWGYRVDGLGTFGSGPTTDESNALVPASMPLFAAIKASTQTADTIANTTAAADPAVSTNVYYGVCADVTVAAGEYTTFVTYSAVTN